MKKEWRAWLIINIGAAIVGFVMFAAEPFIFWLIDKNDSGIPFWAWGLIGVFSFEAVFCFAFIKRKK